MIRRGEWISFGGCESEFSMKALLRKIEGLWRIKVRQLAFISKQIPVPVFRVKRLRVVDASVIPGSNNYILSHTSMLLRLYSHPSLLYPLIIS
jgi:hypothetical protein